MRDVMNCLYVIDVFEEVKDNYLMGQEFCFKLYKSYVLIELKLLRFVKFFNCENVGGSCFILMLGRVYVKEVELRVVNVQQFIIRVKIYGKYYSLEGCERFFKFKVSVKNEKV